MEEALGRKQEVLPELKDAYRQAKDRANDARAAIEQQGNLSNLKNLLAWSFVDEIEKVRSRSRSRSRSAFVMIGSDVLTLCSPCSGSRSARTSSTPSATSSPSARRSSKPWRCAPPSLSLSPRASLACRRPADALLLAVQAKVEAANAQMIDLRDVDQDMHALVAELRPQAAELDSKIKGERDRLRKWKVRPSPSLFLYALSSRADSRTRLAARRTLSAR